MKIKIKKTLLKESNRKIVTYSDLEKIRISLGKIIDRKILTPKIEKKPIPNAQEEVPEESESEEYTDLDQDASFLTNKDYINRIRDVVKKGRKIPYLYYAYKGVDEKGRLGNANNINAVLDLQADKAGDFVDALKADGDATVRLFKIDFGLIMGLQMKWDEAYEEQMQIQTTPEIYDQMLLKKGYDRSKFQAGKGTFQFPFSTVSIGRGSKPLYAQNVDFMYKTSPEPNLRIDADDLWAFSLVIPLYLAYSILTRFDVKRGQTPKQVAQERYGNISEQKRDAALEHWKQNVDLYKKQYIEIIKNNEPDSWVNYVPRPEDFLTLDLKHFNSNYVEHEKAATKKGGEKEPHWIDYTNEAHNFWLMVIQPPLSITKNDTFVYLGLVDKLKEYKTSELAKNKIITMLKEYKDPKICENVHVNLINFLTMYSRYESVQQNIVWLSEATFINYEKTFLSLISKWQLDSSPMYMNILFYYLNNIQNFSNIKKLIEEEMIKYINQPQGIRIHENIIALVTLYKEEPSVRKNLSWLNELNQTWYIMGGK